MKLAFFDDFKLGVVAGDSVVDVTEVVKDISRLGPQDVMRGVIERFDALKGKLASSKCCSDAYCSRRLGRRRLPLTNHNEALPAVKLDLVERIEEHAPIVPSIADVVEARDPVLAARHRLAVDDAGARAYLRRSPR